LCLKLLEQRFSLGQSRGLSLRRSVSLNVPIAAPGDLQIRDRWGRALLQQDGKDSAASDPQRISLLLSRNEVILNRIESMGRSQLRNDV